MAEDEAVDNAGDSARSSGGLVVAIVERVARVWNAITEDGYLAAAWRQGIGELGMALKPFPESIHVDEPGTLWNPTQGEIAEAREIAPSDRSPWPSEIANANRNLPVIDNGRDTGNDAGYSM